MLRNFTSLCLDSIRLDSTRLDEGISQTRSCSSSGRTSREQFEAKIMQNLGIAVTTAIAGFAESRLIKHESRRLLQFSSFSCRQTRRNQIEWQSFGLSRQSRRAN